MRWWTFSGGLLSAAIVGSIVFFVTGQSSDAGTPATCQSAGQVVSVPSLDDRGAPVPAFRIDQTEVTNRQFAQFVRETGFVTDAERQGSAAVFVQPRKGTAGGGPGEWWRLIEGADWRHPQGPDSTIEGKENLPVVQVTFDDAMAYARWRGGTLPTEEQWERAARGTRISPKLPERWRTDDDGQPSANTWTGVFPVVDTAEDGYAGLAPAGCFAPNELGLHDAVGNVWEWTRTEGGQPGGLRGGSYLCARNYCSNYTPAGRQEHERDLATSHAGFRVAYPIGGRSELSSF